MRPARIRIASAAAALLLASGCAAADEQSGSDTTSSSTTSEPSANTGSTAAAESPTTSTTEFRLEWFGSAWTIAPDLIERGTGERRQLRYGTFDADAYRDSGLAAITLIGRNEIDAPISTPNSTPPTVEIDMVRHSVGDPILFVGRARGDAFEGQVDDAAETSEMRLLVRPSGELIFSSPIAGPSEASRMAQTIALLIPPLPDEPIGVGARWTAQLPGQLESDRPAEFEFSLVEDRGDQIVVDVASTATTREFGRGGVATVMEETGHGTIVIDLPTAVPAEVGYTFVGVATIENPPGLESENPPPEPWNFTRIFSVDID